jgi:DNA-binding NtrC family response regulator
MTDARVLVVDDNRNVLTALELLLSREFSGVKCINKPGQIQSELQSASYSAVLLDMNYSAGQNSGNEGLFWLRELQKSDPDLSVVMITAFGDIELAVTALKEGAVDFVLKPWDNQKLLATLRTAVQLCRSRKGSEIPAERQGVPEGRAEGKSTQDHWPFARHEVGAGGGSQGGSDGSQYPDHGREWNRKRTDCQGDPSSICPCRRNHGHRGSGGRSRYAV